MGVITSSTVAVISYPFLNDSSAMFFELKEKNTEIPPLHFISLNPTSSISQTYALIIQKNSKWFSNKNNWK